MPYAHSDNVFGYPFFLSDERIKDIVSSLDISTCWTFCNSPGGALYLRTDLNEIRTGLIAQEVQAALTYHTPPETPAHDTDMASVEGDNPVETLMSLRYERLVPMLLGVIKGLTNRITQLEPHVQ